MYVSAKAIKSEKKALFSFVLKVLVKLINKVNTAIKEDLRQNCIMVPINNYGISKHSQFF